MNRRLRPDIETVFMMAGRGYSFISSRMVKEVSGWAGISPDWCRPGRGAAQRRIEYSDERSS